MRILRKRCLTDKGLQPLVCLLLLSLLRAAQATAGANDVCHVGAQLHLQPAGAAFPYMRHVRAFVEEGMADYVFLVAQALKPEERDEVVRYLADHKVHFLLQEVFPTSSSQSEPRYSAEDLARIRAIAGDLFHGVHWGELDSSGLKPEDYLPPEVLKHPTRAKVKAAFVAYVRERLHWFHDRCRTPFAHSSAVLSHSFFAEAGVDVICSEIGENIPNVNMMLASNRGAARAYDKPWMIDFSTWWAPRGHAGEQVSPREGHTPWCFFTSLLGAAMGGADYAQLEVDWAAYDKQGNLLPWGRALKSLFGVTRAIGPRGNTVTPFAVLLGHENGWPGVGWRIGDVRGTGLFDGIRHEFMQTRDADLSLKILDVFFPGFERCGWDPEYPGFLAESPLGTVDIVPDNLPPEKYARYGVLVALGYHRMTESLRETLRRYVERGGVLVCGDTLFLDEFERPIKGSLDELLIGCVVDTHDRSLIHLSQPQSTLDAVDGFTTAGSWPEWQSHWLHPVRLTTGRVAGRLNDAPYILENAVGAGRVFFITALNMVGSSAGKRGQEPFLYSNLTYRFLHTLNEHRGDGIQFSPWTGLEHILNERPDGTAMLLVMNHGDMPYRRDAVMRNPRGFTTGRVAAQGTWEEWRPGDAIPFTRTGNELAWSFDMPRKSFVLFELAGT